jgi:transposase-like protein
VNQEQQQQRSPSRRRRHYDEEFKRNAVELLESGERSAVQLSQELGVSDCSLGKWKRQYGRQSQACRSGELGAEQRRIAELERELAAVSRQRDILKKALAILGQEPTNSTK